MKEKREKTEKMSARGHTYLVTAVRGRGGGGVSSPHINFSSWVKQELVEALLNHQFWDRCFVMIWSWACASGVTSPPPSLSHCLLTIHWSFNATMLIF